MTIDNNENRRMIKATIRYAKAYFSGDSGGHDWWHTYRVWRLSIIIGNAEENVDMLVVQLAALLHDVADWKLNDNQAQSIKNVMKFLNQLKLDRKRRTTLLHIINNVSFKGAKVRDRMNNKEGMIVQDADRLDAIGAIGIARTFAYGGSIGRAMYDPKVKPKMHRSFNSYKKSNSTTINHFHEKLFLLRGRMNTKKGRELAKKRDAYMKDYLKRFIEEWEGRG